MTLLLIILTFALGFMIVFITIPPILRVAKAKKLFDNKDDRKNHIGIIPPLGGIAIFLGFIFSSIIFTDGYSSLTLKYLIASSILMFFIGLKDDLMNMSAKSKIILQILAVLLLYAYGGVRITDCQGLFGLNEVNNAFSLIITTFVMLAIINSFNLIDGIDGLASGLAIVASILLGTWFFLAGHFQLSVISFALAGSLSSFFIFNVFGKSKKLFMGDTGSLIVGLIIATLVIKFNELNIQKNLAYSLHAAPAISFSLVIVPLIDTLRVITIRLMNKKSPFAADRNHIHHRLLSLYPSHLKVSLILITANVVLFSTALLLNNLLFSVTTQFFILLLLGVFLSFIPSFLLRRTEVIEFHKLSEYNSSSSKRA
jgi:UDP-GlcNAc:undecaprenyl-phosphate/decaprenyl-phosphate GlcNAc-1-phosphate transferase